MWLRHQRADATSTPELGDVVLANCVGGGTTGGACANAGRKFIGMELDANYFQIASDRIEQAFEKRGESTGLFATEVQALLG